MIAQGHMFITHGDESGQQWKMVTITRRNIGLNMPNLIISPRLSFAVLTGIQYAVDIA